MRWLWVLLLLPLAGCLDAPPADEIVLEPDLQLRPADRLEAGGFYAFPHRGGELTMRSVQGAQVELYDAQDRRVGRAQIGVQGFTFQSVGPGELVLRVLELNGTLQVESEDGPVPGFLALPLDFERVVLVDRPASGPTSLLAGESPVQERLAVSLETAPHDLRLLASGDHDGLKVLVRGPLGVVLEAESTDRRLTPFEPGGLRPVAVEFFATNLREAELDVEIKADHFEGVLVLEAWSHSRARAPFDLAPATDGRPLRFDYGELPDRPVRFSIHPAATTVALKAGPAGAVVALHGPDDARLGVYEVEGNATLRLPVPEAGDWVAVLLSGKATLHSDRAPADFELHVLERAETVVPGPREGEGYRQESHETDVDGVLYAAEAAQRPARVEEWFFLSCDASGTLRLRQDGMTLGIAHGGLEFLQDPSPLLVPGPVEVQVDGSERSCPQPAVRLWSYHR